MLNKNNNMNLIKKKITFPPKINHKDLISFFLNLNLKEYVKKSRAPNRNINILKYNDPYKPELLDLYRLYQFVLLNNRTTILEFGCGYSSLIFSLALKKNKIRFNNIIKNYRRTNPFELFILDNEKKYLNLTRSNINKHNKKFKISNPAKINYFFSDLEMRETNNKYVTLFKKFPLVNPDFIYLDGPDQFKVKKKINNFHTGHNDLMPMAADIIKIENYLIPGTIIVTDGRGANAELMFNNFQRKWLYYYDKDFDQHIFYLNSNSFGKINDNLLKFYKKK